MLLDLTVYVWGPQPLGERFGGNAGRRLSLGRRFVSLDLAVFIGCATRYLKRYSGAVKALESRLGNQVFPEDEITKGKAIRPGKKEEEGLRLRECLLVRIMLHMTFT